MAVKIALVEFSVGSVVSWELSMAVKIALFEFSIRSVVS